MNLAPPDELFSRHADVFGYLPQQDWRNIASRMERYGRASPIGMPILTMRAALAHHRKAHLQQNGFHLGRFQHGHFTHLCHRDDLHPYKLTGHLYLAILLKHL
jgi:hypothetical protein